MGFSRGVADPETVDILSSFGTLPYTILQNCQEILQQPDIYDISDQVILVLTNIACLKLKL